MVLCPEDSFESDGNQSKKVPSVMQGQQPKEKTNLSFSPNMMMELRL